jgi:peptidoglycan/xylan/chitin deacetylase (PgdA/CDA1 family)
MLILLSAAAFALVDIKNYPSPNQPPPIVPEWSRIFLQGKAIPNIPVRTEKLEDYDWTPDILSCTGRNDWALTYDDGTSVFTTNVTKELELSQGKATFFVIGSQVLMFQKQLIALHEAGHQIGIHTWSHTELTFQSNEQIVSEMLWTAKLIKDIIGVTPKQVRSPRGDIDPRVRAVIRAMGFVHTVWNRDTFDWQFTNYRMNQPGPSPQEIVRTFEKWIAEPRSGRISLQHDAARFPASVIGQTIRLVKAANYTMKTVASCINDNPYDETILQKVQNVTLPVFNRAVVTTTTSTETLPSPTTRTSSSIRIGVNLLSLFFLLF